MCAQTARALSARNHLFNVRSVISSSSCLLIFTTILFNCDNSIITTIPIKEHVFSLLFQLALTLLFRLDAREGFRRESIGMFLCTPLKYCFLGIFWSYRSEVLTSLLLFWLLSRLEFFQDMCELQSRSFRKWRARVLKFAISQGQKWRDLCKTADCNDLPKVKF